MPRKNDGMDGAFNWLHDALIYVLLPVVVAMVVLFTAAEWALDKNRVVWTALTAFVLSLGVIWGVSAWNGM